MALVTSSHARARGVRKGPAFLAVVYLAFSAGAAGAGVSVEVRGDDIALNADAATLREILEALSEARVLDVTASMPLQSEVTLATGPEPLARLLRRLLRCCSYTLMEQSGQLPRLHVFADTDPGAPVTWVARPSADATLVDRAIADLANPDEDVRAEAVLTLSDSGDPEAVILFLSTLGDPSPDVREAARAALEDMDTAVPGGFGAAASSRQGD